MPAHLPSSNALRAALTASSTSALSPSAISASPSSLAGLTVTKVLPDLAGTHLPPISNCLAGPFTNSTAAVDVAPLVDLSIDDTAAAIFVLPSDQCCG